MYEFSVTQRLVFQWCWAHSSYGFRIEDRVLKGQCETMDQKEKKKKKNVPESREEQRNVYLLPTLK